MSTVPEVESAAGSRRGFWAGLRQFAVDGLRVCAQIVSISICLLPIQLVGYGVNACLPSDLGSRGRLVVVTVMIPVLILWLGFAYPRVHRNLWAGRA